MASVFHFGPYEWYKGTAFLPGQEHTWWFGPFDWRQKAVVITAHPFDATGSNRRLSVTYIDSQTTPDRYINCRIRNIGPDPIYIYYIYVGGTAP
jgi:hypothetical protein